MKKFLLSLMVFVLLVSAFFFNTGTARAATAPILTDVHFVTGKGIVFVFDLNGLNLRTPNLKGAVLYLHGNSYPLACRVNEENGTIVCTVRGGLSRDFAGDQGTILLLGFWYTVIIPSPPDPYQPQYECNYELRGARIPCCGIGVICDVNLSSIR